MSGSLIKLTIIPFSDSETVQVPIPSGPPVIAQFNPESLSITTKFNYAEEETLGQVGSEGKYESISPRSFSFDILLDGTGASGVKLEIHPLIKLFDVTTGFNGNIHRPSFFMISWGSILIKCVLKQYTINYKMFTPAGLPLRAVISTQWQEMISKEYGQMLLNLLSPDVTHIHDIIDKESLPLICYRTYKDTKYYVQVAQGNKLNNLRELTVGKKLKLHPLKP